MLVLRFALLLYLLCLRPTENYTNSTRDKSDGRPAVTLEEGQELILVQSHLMRYTYQHFATKALLKATAFYIATRASFQPNRVVTGMGGRCKADVGWCEMWVRCTAAAEFAEFLSCRVDIGAPCMKKGGPLCVTPPSLFPNVKVWFHKKPTRKTHPRGIHRQEEWMTKTYLLRPCSQATGSSGLPCKLSPSRGESLAAVNQKVGPRLRGGEKKALLRCSRLVVKKCHHTRLREPLELPSRGDFVDAVKQAPGLAFASFSRELSRDISGSCPFRK